LESPLEIEVKFYLGEPEVIRQRIERLGGDPLGRVFEHNIRFDDAGDTLRKRDMLLRLRRDDRVRLTFKAPPDNPDRSFKIHREVETQVGDFDACRQILEALGFHARQTYEKWRETFVLGNTKLLIDETPFGVFLEIEGEKPAIRTLSGDLGLPWEERIVLNYLQIFEIIREKEGLSFEDMTFDNFRGISVNMKKYVPLLHAD
jgi:adenylate cyclase class 2